MNSQVCFWVILTTFYPQLISPKVNVWMSKVNLCAYKKWFHACTPFLGKSNWLLLTGKHIHLCYGLLVLLEGCNRAGSRGIFSWHCSCKCSSHFALIWRRPGWIKLRVELLKLRSLLLLQTKIHSPPQHTIAHCGGGSVSLTVCGEAKTQNTSELVALRAPTMWPGTFSQ